MAYRSPIKPKRHSTLAAAALMAVSIAILAGMGAINFLMKAPTLDSSTLCRADQPVTAHTVVLVDTTDALDHLQMAQLRAAIYDARDGLPQYGKLTVLFLSTKTPYEPTEVISLCNPGSWHATNPLYQNPERIRRIWTRDFAKKIDGAVAGLAHAPTAKLSPILEAITGISWRPDFSRRIAIRRLVIISDFLEYDPGVFSLYKVANPWSRYMRSGLVSRTQADLSGVAIRAVMLHRPEWVNLQSHTLRDFWRRWFLDCGVTTVHFRSSLPGQARPKEEPRLSLRGGR